MSNLFSGEPYAGKPHVRFGGRGASNGALPYPYPSKIVGYSRVPGMPKVIMQLTTKTKLQYVDIEMNILF